MFVVICFFFFGNTLTSKDNPSRKKDKKPRYII